MDALSFVHSVMANTQKDTHASRVEENQTSDSKAITSLLNDTQRDKVSLSQESILKFMEKHTLGGPGHDKNAISFTDLAQKIAQHEALPAGQQDNTLLSIMDALELKINIEQTLTGYNHHGTRISVNRIPKNEEMFSATNTTDSTYSINIKQKNGKDVTIDFTDNIKMQEYSDGSLALYFSNTGNTKFYTKDGEIREQEGYLLKDNVHTTIVNITDSEIYSGDNGSIIFNFADNTTIHGGLGDDAIILVDGVDGAIIDTGSGDDTIIGGRIKNSIIEMGDGNNTIQTGEFKNGKINMGNGNNSLEIATLSINTTLSVGNGNNSVDIKQINYNSFVNIGNGNNSISISEVGKTAFESKLFSLNTQKYGNAQVNIGNGNNKVAIYEITNSSKVTIGDGNNYLEMQKASKNGQLHFGEGNNTIKTLYLYDNSIINVGNGNNSIQVSTFDDNSSLFVGDGANSLKVRFMAKNSNVSLGDGNNDISIHTMENESSLTLGGGNNILQVINANDNATLSLKKSVNTFLQIHNASSKSLLSADGMLSYLRDSEIGGDKEKRADFLEELRNDRLSKGLPVTGTFSQERVENYFLFLESFPDISSIFVTARPQVQLSKHI